jgi:beta-1,4-mannosyl-glycoprotein beta-1,4-N-acetylglucosaminyltransferase
MKKSDDEWKLVSEKGSAGVNRSDSSIYYELPKKRKYFVLGTFAVILLCIFLFFSNYNKTVNDSDETPNFGFLPISQAQQICNTHNWNIYPDRESHRKIYDLFMVHTELDWLEIRMGQMWDRVDYFVVIESPITFVGASKPLFVKDNYDSYKKYHSKMILHTLDLTGASFNTAWDREYFQRNGMYDQVFPALTGPQKPKNGDIILVSDVDEIPRPESLDTLRNCIFPAKVTLRSLFYYYSFQWLHAGDEWPYPQATFYNGDKTVKPQDLRNEPGNKDAIRMPNAAWHCSYCFSKIDDVVKKLKSFSHIEYSTEEYTNRKKILHRFRHGIDLFDRPGERYDFIRDNQDVPIFLKENSEKFKYMLNRDPPSGNFIDYTEADADTN